MILVNIKFATISFRFDAYKIIFLQMFFLFKFCYCVLYGTKVMFLTQQNMFLENLRY